MTDPKIYLAVDNCFASKRWTRPAEWMDVLGSMGVACVEASSDTEVDPLYMGPDYLERWMEEVKEEGAKRGMRVVNLFSGHGSYMTLGLAHHDPAVRDRFQQMWLKPMIRTAASLDAGFGFYCHAFSDAVLQNPAANDAMETELYDRLADLAVYARELGMRTPGVEQMYTPHQMPWTIEGAKRLLREVYRRSRSPFYLTLDTGHQSGQRKFVRPRAEQIAEAAARFRDGGHQPAFWLGPKTADEAFARLIETPEGDEEREIARILAEMDAYPHLFAEPEDGDTYRWIQELGGYSPIMHLQQTTGLSSAHLPFTEEHNRSGIVHGKAVLDALAAAYSTPDEDGMPPKCGEVYLTLEVFSGTSELNADILHKIRKSVEYWRNFIPVDGLRLSELIGL